MEEKSTERVLGRNEPCPCGSGKKYKRCCGVSAAPKLGAPKMPEGFPGQVPGQMPPGTPDLSKMDPEWMMQFSQALQRLPKGQMQRLQALMQKAMSGKDITREAAELEKILPPELQSLMMSFKMPEGAEMPGMPGMGTLPGAGLDQTPAANMTEDEARAIVESAIASGKLSQEEAQSLLDQPSNTESEKAESKSKFSKLWQSMKGKNA